MGFTKPVAQLRKPIRKWKQSLGCLTGTAGRSAFWMWIGRPIDPDLLSNIAALVREELDQEAAAGFPKLTRIPSTGVIRLLDYLASLPPAEHAPLRDALARLG